MIPDHIMKIKQNLTKPANVSVFAFVFYAFFDSYRDTIRDIEKLSAPGQNEYEEFLKECTIYFNSISNLDTLDIDRGMTLLSSMYFKTLDAQRYSQRKFEESLIDIQVDRFRRKYFFWTTTILFLVGILLWIKNIYFFHL